MRQERGGERIGYSERDIRCLALSLSLSTPIFFSPSSSAASRNTCLGSVRVSAGGVFSPLRGYSSPLSHSLYLHSSFLLILSPTSCCILDDGGGVSISALDWCQGNKLAMRKIFSF